MGFLTDWLTDWLKGLLIEGIMGNLTGLFDPEAPVSRREPPKGGVTTRDN